MRRLVLFGRVNNAVTSVEQFTMEDCSLNGQGRDGTGLELNEVSTANIMRFSFSSNTGREVLLHGETRHRGRAGGAIIVMTSRLYRYYHFRQCTQQLNS